MGNVEWASPGAKSFPYGSYTPKGGKPRNNSILFGKVKERKPHQMTSRFPIPIKAMVWGVVAPPRPMPSLPFLYNGVLPHGATTLMFSLKESGASQNHPKRGESRITKKENRILFCRRHLQISPDHIFKHPAPNPRRESALPRCHRHGETAASQPQIQKGFLFTERKFPFL